MNNRLTHLVVVGLFAGMSVVAGCGGGGGDGQQSTSRKLLILHTNDLHSYVMGHGGAPAIPAVYATAQGRIVR